MIFSATLAVALASALGAVAVPVENKGVQHISAHRNSNYVFDGAAATRKVLRKYGRPIPKHLETAGKFRSDASGTGTGTVTASPQEDEAEWLCPVTVGSTTMNLDFDTGSSDLWVFSNLQKSGTSGHNVYPCSGKSSIGTWSISYGDGSSASGTAVRDKVTVGGVTVQSQAVECSKTMSSEFSQGSGDGLLGLGFKSINTIQPTPQDTFMGNAVSQGLLTSPVFTADLRHGSARSSYTFGTCTCGSSVNWVSADSSDGWYQFTGGYKSTSGRTNYATAIADTGTTLLYINSAALKAWFADTGFKATNSASAGGYVFPCSKTPPNLTLTISGSSKAITVPGSLLNYGQISSGSSSCFLGVQDSADIGIDIWGDTFLKAITACFDEQNSKFGWCSKV